jgi:predicted dehydrogenase
MKVGIIGCGAVAHYCHVPALLRIRGVTITAVADPNEMFRNRVARATGSPAFKSAEFLLANSSVDAVVIATPPHTHAAIGKMAALAGKAIYLEKPIATSLSEARDLSLSTAEAGIKAVVGFNRRSHPLYARARDMIERGSVGRVRALQTTFCEPVPVDGMPAWKEKRATGGGALLDLASHHIDLVRWLTGSEISTVSAEVSSDESEHDSASMQLRLENGISVQSFVSFRAGYAERVTVIGDDGTLEIDRHRATLTLQTARRMGYGARRRFILPSISDVTWKARGLISRSHDPSYHRALSAFANGGNGLASLHDGERSLQAVIAAEESAALGRPVTLQN